jgi:hypothetical protein
MPLIDLTLQHGRTLDEARRRLEMTVNEVTGKFGSMVQRVEWAADRSRAKLMESDSGSRCRLISKRSMRRAISRCWVGSSALR